MNMKELISQIDKIDNMQDMNNVIASLKIRRAFLKNELARKAKATFKVGDKVKIFTSRKNKPELFGVITDIKIKKLKKKAKQYRNSDGLGLYLTVLRNEKTGELIKFNNIKSADNFLKNIQKKGVKAFIHETKIELLN